MGNWKDELEESLAGEELIEINIAGTMYYPEMLGDALKRLDKEFYAGHPRIEGEPFWAWTKTSVYFCIVYDGAEWIERVPRNPQLGSPKHFGDG